jgi:IS30 family transposase
MATQHRRRVPNEIPEQQKLAYIQECRRRGISYRRIAEALNMSHSAVQYMERRLTDPEGYYRQRNGEDFGDEVDHPTAGEDW